jgi:hypothetical protein
MRRVSIVVVLVVLSILCSISTGCSTTRTVRDKPLDLGATHQFHSDYARVLQVTRESIPDVGLAMKDEQAIPGGGVMLLATRGITAWSYGEVVRAVVQPGSDSTSVRVLTERAFGMNATAKMDFADDLFTKIGQKLGEHP